MASTADSPAAIKTEHCAYQSIHLTDNQIRKEFCENDYRRFYAPLFFANSEYFLRRIQTLVANSTEPVKWVLVDVQAVSEIDVPGAGAIQRLARDLEARGLSLKFARANRPLRKALDRIRLGGRLRDEQLFPSVHAAIETFRHQESSPTVSDDHNIDNSTKLR